MVVEGGREKNSPLGMWLLGGSHTPAAGLTPMDKWTGLIGLRVINNNKMGARSWKDDVEGTRRKSWEGGNGGWIWSESIV